MKKLIIILLCVVVAAVGAGIFLRAQKAELAVENILPQGPVAFVQLNDVEKNMREMASAPFWQAVQEINYDFLIKQNVISPQQRMFISFIQTQLSEVLASPVSKKLFGREVAFAVYPPDRDVGALVQEMKVLDPALISELLSGLVLVTRVDQDVQFAEYLSRSLTQVGANVSKGQVEYKGEIVHTIIVSGVGVKFAFVRLKDLLVVGIGEEAARKSIDVYKKSKPSLAQNAQFGKIRSTFLDPAGIMGFFDFETLTRLLKSQVGNLAGLGAKDPGNAVSEQTWNDLLARMAGLETFTFSSQLGPVMKFSSNMLMDPKKINPEYAPLYTCPSVINKTIDFVPKEVLGYQWSNCSDLNYYWKEIKKELARTDTPMSRIDDIEAQIGLSIEGDILPAFGDELGGYVSDMQTGGLFPIPKLALFIKVKSKPKAQLLLDKLRNQSFAMLQNETYNGVSLEYLALPFGEAVQPGYCFLGDYLLIATTRQSLKDSIDASANASMALAANPAFKAVDYGLTGKNRSVQFVKVGQVIEKIKGIIGWSNEWITARERKAQAFKAGSARPLEEVKANIAVKEDELSKMRDNISALEDEVWDLDIKQEDASAQQAQLAGLKTQVEALELEISDEYERRAELENIVQQSTQNVPDTALRQSYLDEVIYPILESLKSIESYGLHVTFEKDVFESSVFIKIAD